MYGSSTGTGCAEPPVAGSIGVSALPRSLLTHSVAQVPRGHDVFRSDRHRYRAHHLVRAGLITETVSLLLLGT